MSISQMPRKVDHKVIGAVWDFDLANIIMDTAGIEIKRKIPDIAGLESINILRRAYLKSLI